jgi:hypothetical protein
MGGSDGYALYRLKLVMLGLVPGIHVFAHTRKKDVDGRVKPGHDKCSETKVTPFADRAGALHSFGRIFSTSASLGR